MNQNEKIEFLELLIKEQRELISVLKEIVLKQLEPSVPIGIGTNDFITKDYTITCFPSTNVFPSTNINPHKFSRTFTSSSLATDCLSSNGMTWYSNNPDQLDSAEITIK